MIPEKTIGARKMGKSVCVSGVLRAVNAVRHEDCWRASIVPPGVSASSRTANRAGADILPAELKVPVMTSRYSNPVLAWLCLVSFVLTNTLLASGLVVCRDGHGSTRVEWGCNQNSNGECVTSCGSDADLPDEDHGPTHPCDDTPIKGGHLMTKAPSSNTTKAGAAGVPVCQTAAVVLIDAAARPPTPKEKAAPQRPPDTLLHLRTVILIV